MCQFKSGVILKNRVVLAPIYNESHSDLLRKLNIEDTTENAMTKFVRAELVPPKGDKTAELKKWKYIVDQDVVPDWYSEDPYRYENEFRASVEQWVKETITIICGKPCVTLKKDDKGTYYMLWDILFESKFGKDNNYATSYVRENLQTCDFVKELKESYGDRLVPITTDLFSMDGFDDYGKVEGDILALRTFDLNRECRRNIPNANKWEWLATPNSTPSGCSSDDVQYVDSSGCVDYCWYCGSVAVRPFFILKAV